MSSFQQPSHSPARAPKSVPPGTFPTGTIIRVGSHKCTIDRYLSEGGFAHVYLVKLNQIVNGTDVAVLKRVAVPDKEALSSMRTEVETMKRLKGHRHIVTYIDSHASQMKGGGYEVFLIMEFCDGGGLIDFMNTRLQNRLTEPEILKIFMDVSEGVACMHYLKPPLLHRDLKIENILITSNPRTYKLCDFGSCSETRMPAKSTAESRLIEEDIQKHTTMQYRSPEMVNVYKGLPIDEKSDIWALGVLLYKLCYYTTPFEDQGQLAILNASYKFPSYPSFSDQLKKLIASMLQEDPKNRPTIYQVVREVCRQRNTDIPIQDIYAGSTSGSRKVPPSVTPTTRSSQPMAALVREDPVPAVKAELPDIVQMRRGRPQNPKNADLGSNLWATPSTSRSPNRPTITNDPFAALDMGVSKDELSNRFPSLEQFSLLHDSGTKFEFDDASPVTTPPPPKKDLNTRVMERLADDAFETMPPTSIPPKLSSRVQQTTDVGRPEEDGQKRPEMVSVGTMTSRSPTPQSMLSTTHQMQDLTIDQSRQPMHAMSLPTRTSNFSLEYPTTADYRLSSEQNSPLVRQSIDLNRPSSAIGSRPVGSRNLASRTRSRPNSTHIESNLDFLRDLDSTKGNPLKLVQSSPLILQSSATGQSTSSAHSDHIESSVDFLRVLQQDAQASKNIKAEKRAASAGAPVSKHAKKPSMGSRSLSNTKTMLAGRFGDAFKKFEVGGVDQKQPASPDERDNYMSQEHSFDDGTTLQVTSTDIPPEMRREIEKRQLADEERRVEAAAAEYKRSLANGQPGRPVTRNRAGSIQRKVQALLDEENRSPVVRTAEGYGKYTTTQNMQASLEDLNTPARAKTVTHATYSMPSQQTLGILQEPLGSVSGHETLSTAHPIQARSSTRLHGGSLRGSGMAPPKPGPKPEKFRKPISASEIRQTSNGKPSLQAVEQSAEHHSIYDSLGKAALNDSTSLSRKHDDQDEVPTFRQRFPSLSSLEYRETKSKQ